MASGGAERVVSILSNNLIFQYDVYIITNTKINQDFYLLNENINRFTLNLNSKSNSIISALFNNFRRIVGLRKIIKQIGPCTLIGFSSISSISIIFASFGLKKINLIGSERTYPPGQPLNFYWEFLRKHFYYKLDYLVTQTETTSRWIKVNTNSKKISIIHNPIELDSSNFSYNPYEKQLNCKIILAVGRLIDLKQFDLLIISFSNLKKKNKDLKLYIVGEGEARIKLEKLIEKLNLTNDVFLVGRKKDIINWYHYSDIFVLTSKVEGFPNSLLEAMYLGKAVISFNCLSGPSELIINNKNGILIEQNDWNSLEVNLHNLLSDNSLRIKLGNTAKKDSQKFNVSQIIKFWIKLIENE